MGYSSSTRDTKRRKSKRESHTERGEGGGMLLEKNKTTAKKQWDLLIYIFYDE
jgi:hypothetical protein